MESVSVEAAVVSMLDSAICLGASVREMALSALSVMLLLLRSKLSAILASFSLRFFSFSKAVFLICSMVPLGELQLQQSNLQELRFVIISFEENPLKEYMYRNVYLECYKTAMSQQQNNVEMLICHFNYAYVAMGSILNDIEYAVGKLLSNQNAQQKIKQQQQQEAIQIKREMFDKTKKSIESFDLAPQSRQTTYTRTSQDRYSKPIQHKQPIPESRQPAPSATIQFDELFKLNPKPGSTSSNAKADKGKSPSTKNMAQTSTKHTPTPGQDDDDILEHLFRKK